MKVEPKKVIGLPAYTQSEKYLGKVIEIEKELLSDEVTLFYVQAHSLITKLLKGTDVLIIPEEQVVSIDQDKMIVKDLSDQELVSSQEFFKNKNTSPVMSSEVD